MDVIKALSVLNDVADGQRQMMASGFMPRVMEDKMIDVIKALDFAIAYIKDNETIKSL